jgi:hypothetical protein
VDLLRRLDPLDLEVRQDPFHRDLEDPLHPLGLLLLEYLEHPLDL